MKLNTKVRYGLRAMIQIALAGDEGILQKTISEKQQISNKYLDHIIIDLRSSGLIVKSSYKNKGYRLAKLAEEITAYDIYKAFRPEITLTPCANKNIDCDCEIEKDCFALDFWAGLNSQIVDYFKSHTLADVIAKSVKLEV